jgi:hypothetical protein
MQAPRLTHTLLLAPLLTCACFAAFAQTAPAPGVSPNATPDKAGSNAVDCGKAANQRLPDCSVDKGAPHTPASGVDRGIQRDTPPRTNDGRSGAMSAPRPPGDIVEDKKESTTVPR